MILGVCEWLGGKFDIKPSAIRIGFVVAILFFGAGIGVYFLLWLVKLLSD